jgi:hypothetical protein
MPRAGGRIPAFDISLAFPCHQKHKGALPEGAVSFVGKILVISKNNASMAGK